MDDSEVQSVACTLDRFCKCALVQILRYQGLKQAKLCSDFDKYLCYMTQSNRWPPRMPPQTLASSGNPQAIQQQPYLRAVDARSGSTQNPVLFHSLATCCHPWQIQRPCLMVPLVTRFRGFSSCRRSKQLMQCCLSGRPTGFRRLEDCLAPSTALASAPK